MLDTLIALTDTEAFEHAGGFRISSVQETGDGLLLDVTVVPGDDTEDQRWRIQCSAVREHQFSSEFVGSIRVVSEHPLLLPHAEHRTNLYFSCSAPNPLATVGALWERHRQLVGSWLPFETFLNMLPKGLSTLLASPSGQLASGPMSLMQAYADVLTEHGVRSSMLPPSQPKYWDGEQWVVQTRPLSALLFDTSYVIAESFDAERLKA